MPADPVSEASHFHPVTAAAIARTINGDTLCSGVASTVDVAGSKGFEQRTPAKDCGRYKGAAGEIRNASLLENTLLSVTPREVKGSAAGMRWEVQRGSLR